MKSINSHIDFLYHPVPTLLNDQLSLEISNFDDFCRDSNNFNYHDKEIEQYQPYAHFQNDKICLKHHVNGGAPSKLITLMHLHFCRWKQKFNGIFSFFCYELICVCVLRKRSLTLRFIDFHYGTYFICTIISSS